MSARIQDVAGGARAEELKKEIAARVEKLNIVAEGAEKAGAQEIIEGLRKGWTQEEMCHQIGEIDTMFGFDEPDITELARWLFEVAPEEFATMKQIACGPHGVDLSRAIAGKLDSLCILVTDEDCAEEAELIIEGLREGKDERGICYQVGVTDTTLSEAEPDIIELARWLFEDAPKELIDGQAHQQAPRPAPGPHSLQSRVLSETDEMPRSTIGSDKDGPTKLRYEPFGGKN
ncbi:unnamed protein product [Zymoseptoria tritici ST99CH_3D7]|uniref:Uncharacterized protein n=1 Tax=Zymoseptoria tritici (strain ST99CH_3D7) TaxID=1276538 RepID=A0A1X7RPI0_ZYMT9|nr:unnamed protein product [Zymoseptoria tritici ST99CH_3D7]